MDNRHAEELLACAIKSRDRGLHQQAYGLFNVAGDRYQAAGLNLAAASCYAQAWLEEPYLRPVPPVNTAAIVD